MRQKVSKPKRTPAPAEAPTPASRVVSHEVLIGIDPSLRGTGYGVVRLGKPHPTALAFGTISCPAGWERSRCLAQIARTLREVIRKHQPSVCAIEGLFFAQNLQTALIMGEARGAALVAVAEAGLDVYEHAPRRVKQAVVGFGGAQKLAIAKMVQRMLRLSETPSPDAADALAVALTHAQETSRYSLTPARRV
ncbi:MAG: crossover junction endodeoxyribonuclease RuvC [Verrucomicrobia bacterium]|nr:crossover junction endodeoxyribonuclease RuvC [Verrucomicrobiota bacterium]MBI3867612.1 crossover junction endodeoxyribonuclease RuvC [Verrucomicrobiota bacterium]